MKKIFIFAALMLGLASCQNDNNIFGVNVNTNEEAVEFTITATAPEVEQTRAAYTDSGEGAIKNGVLADDNVTLRYILDVYIWNDTESKYELSTHRFTEYSDDRVVNFKPTLVPSRRYNFVVWADVVTKIDGNWVNNLYNVTDLQAVTIDDTKWAPMDEKRDAYTGNFVVESLEKTSAINIPLTRPFGKLRIVTLDLDKVKELHITPTYAEVTYQAVPTYSFNATNGTYTPAGTGTMNKTHAKFAIAGYASNNNTNMTLFTDYFFAPSDNEVALGNFTLEVLDQNQKKITETSFATTIPVKRNRLTTITGKLLTITANPDDANSFKVTATTGDDFTEWKTYEIQ